MEEFAGAILAGIVYSGLLFTVVCLLIAGAAGYLVAGPVGGVLGAIAGAIIGFWLDRLLHERMQRWAKTMKLRTPHFMMGLLLLVVGLGAVALLTR